jgi:hypothetical protein
VPGKYALIIGNTEYTDPGLATLTAPGKDAAEFARILRDPDICAFDDVRILLNQLSSSAIEVMDEFFDERKPDDLLVLYFSGHGVRDEFGSLYLAFSNTIRSRLLSTAIKAEYIREAMDHSRSRRQVIVLDCCNSGAFPQGTKAELGGSMGLMNALQGYGRYVLTASDATQFAWEGDKLIGGTQNSLFTHFIVKGLEGEADTDSDGKITIDNLYDYAFEQISRATPMQTPTKSASKQEGEIVLRQIQRIQDIRPVTLPDELLEAAEDARTFVREGAVQQLERLLKGRNLGLARSAREALEKIANEDDSLRVRQLATQALTFVRDAEPQAAEQPSTDAAAAPPAEPRLQQESPPVDAVSLPVVATPSPQPQREPEAAPASVQSVPEVPAPSATLVPESAPMLQARPKRKRATRKAPAAAEATEAPPEPAVEDRPAPQAAEPSPIPAVEEHAVAEAPSGQRAERKPQPAPKATEAQPIPVAGVPRSPAISTIVRVQPEVARQPALVVGVPAKSPWRMLGIIGAALSVVVMAGLLLAKPPAAPALEPSAAPFDSALEAPADVSSASGVEPTTALSLPAQVAPTPAASGGVTDALQATELPPSTEAPTLVIPFYAAVRYSDCWDHPGATDVDQYGHYALTAGQSATALGKSDVDGFALPWILVDVSPGPEWGTRDDCCWVDLNKGTLNVPLDQLKPIIGWQDAMRADCSEFKANP